jgi:NAD(P)-dependent dehydrogenase (short-subunit alcohol dehydrogenase family)
VRVREVPFTLATLPGDCPAIRVALRSCKLHAVMDPTDPVDNTLTDDDVRTCVRVLRAIDADRSHLTRLPQEVRRELLTFAGLVAKPERHGLVRMAKAFRRAEREAAKQHDREVIGQAGLRVQRRSAVYAPLWLEPPDPRDLPGQGDDAGGGELRRERACYVCKRPFVRMHRYYDALCVACGDFNYAKRSQTADLGGHYAVVTGARVKIGFQAALKLLRAGAHVVVTTRFPVDAAERYAQEADFESFGERLQIHGLDLRHTPSVERFAAFLLERLPRLDHLLNNACQTVRRPTDFFRHLLAKESVPLAALPQNWRGLLTGHDELARASQGLPAVAGNPSSRHANDGADALFPAGRYDEDRQQVDLRSVNSWRLRLHEVETPELLEVHLVNAIAPFLLNARLKPLMLRTSERHKHIVNVSAMEGQFYRTTKTDKHPHTNMAKAALNMMTRTAAPDFVKDGIHMNAVDTGWVTDEDPAVHAARKAELGFAPPLDIIDGAARIVDPIFSGRLTGTHLWGQFLKDYRPAPW